jgi:pilus assembly protein Flp/PilA
MRDTFLAAMTSIKRYFEKKGVDGQALVEYALILALIAVVAIGILGALGGNVVNTLTTVSTAVGSAS